MADLLHAGYSRAEQGRGPFVQAPPRALHSGQMIAVCYHGSRGAGHYPHHNRITPGVFEIAGSAEYAVVTTTWDVEAERRSIPDSLRECGIRGADLFALGAYQAVQAQGLSVW